MNHKRENKAFYTIRERLIITEDNWFLPLKEDLLLCMLAINSLSNGFFIFGNEGQAEFFTSSYRALIEIMPMDVWGTLFVMCGIFMLVGALFVRNIKTKSYLLLISGFVGFVLWALYSLIGIEFGTSGVTPIRNMAFSVIHLVIGSIQIMEIWRIRLHTKNLM